MPADIFGSRVQYHICPVCKRARDTRGGKSRINESFQVHFFSQRSQSRYISYCQQRIGQSLEEKHLTTTCPISRPYLVGIFHIYKSGFDTKTGQLLGQQTVSAAINLPISDDVVAAFQRRQQRRRNRAHPRTASQSRLRPFQFSHCLLKFLLIGRTHPIIIPTRVARPHYAHHRFQVWKSIDR